MMMAERGTIDEQAESFRQHATAETQSKVFDYIAGKTEGPLAAAEAALEHTAGYLGVEIEENAKLRAENEQLMAALDKIMVLCGGRHQGEAAAAAAFNIALDATTRVNEQLPQGIDRMSYWRPIESAPKDYSIAISKDRKSWVGVKWDKRGQFWTDSDDVWWPKDVEGWFWAPYDSNRPQH